MNKKLLIIPIIAVAGVAVYFLFFKKGAKPIEVRIRELAQAAGGSGEGALNIRNVNTEELTYSNNITEIKSPDNTVSFMLPRRHSVIRWLHLQRGGMPVRWYWQLQYMNIDNRKVFFKDL